jgi:hypothetical protein
MNKKRIIISVIVLFFPLLFYAQQDDDVNKGIHKNEGFFNITKISFSTTTKIRQELFIPERGNIFRDVEPNDSKAWSLHTINGFFLSPTLSLGLGIGLENHDNPNFNLLPIFLDARAYLSDEGESLYTFLDVGPTIRLGGDESGLNKGVIFNFGIGYKFQVINDLFMVSDAFYSHKTVSLTDEGIGTSDNFVKVNGFGISIGVIF